MHIANSKKSNKKSSVKKRVNKNAQRCIEAQFRDKDKSFTAALRNDLELTHLEQSGFSLLFIV